MNSCPLARIITSSRRRRHARRAVATAPTVAVSRRARRRPCRLRLSPNRHRRRVCRRRRRRQRNARTAATATAAPALLLLLLLSTTSRIDEARRVMNVARARDRTTRATTAATTLPSTVRAAMRAQRQLSCARLLKRSVRSTATVATANCPRARAVARVRVPARSMELTRRDPLWLHRRDPLPSVATAAAAMRVRLPKLLMRQARD